MIHKYTQNNAPGYRVRTNQKAPERFPFQSENKRETNTWRTKGNKPDAPWISSESESGYKQECLPANEKKSMHFMTVTNWKHEQWKHNRWVLVHLMSSNNNNATTHLHNQILS